MMEQSNSKALFMTDEQFAEYRRKQADMHDRLMAAFPEPRSDKERIEELETLVAQQAAVIEQMRKALQRCTKFTQEDYDALALQPCPEVLNKARANAVELAAHEAWMSASSDCEDRVKAAVLLLAQRMEQGEA